jgi:single-strand DNA-binding protein
MAGSYNHLVLVGRLTKDPELKTLQNGAVCSFSIAVNRRTKAGDEVMYVDCSAFNNANVKLADTCSQYLRKGMNVLVDGRLSIRDYQTKEGEKRKATSVILNNMQMLDSKKDNEGAQTRELVGAAAGSNGSSRSTTTSSDFDEDPDGLEEIPF